MIRSFRFIFLAIGITFLCGNAFSQDGIIKGQVHDDIGKPVEEALVKVEGTEIQTVTNSEGDFQINIKPGEYILVFNRIGFVEAKEQVTVRPSATELISVKMLNHEYDVVRINANGDIKDKQRFPFMELIPIPLEAPSIKSDITSRLITSGAGVSTNNEFSSQYRVRGGNFDENLVYVNDIEIYRPFLIRSGQQEGLGFVNTSLVSEISFSSGGFQAKYGDRLSSVLDVSYRNPDRLRGSAEAGILNANFHVEDRFYLNKEILKIPEEYRKFTPAKITYMIGARRFTPAYVLGSLDTKGNYKPAFHDVQCMFTFVPKQKNKFFREVNRKNGVVDTLFLPQEKFKITFFGHLADNQYKFIPETRETSFGTIQNVFRLRVGFQGQEVTSYQTSTGAVVFDYFPNLRFRVKYILSAFYTAETELFDVEGGYFLSDVNTNFGSDGYNEVVFDRGIGTFFRHARNFLDASVIAGEQKGMWVPDKNFRHKVEWGIRAQKQTIFDKLKEWNGVDSSGYFRIDETFQTSAEIRSNVAKIYLQDALQLNAAGTAKLILGARAIYNDLNQQLMLAPRVQLVFTPRKQSWEEDPLNFKLFGDSKRLQLRFAAGIYHQPAFYREMRALDGELNTARDAQQSWHFIAGADYLFKIWGRPFRLFTEAYYKYLGSIIPYEVENVRIRYYPFNNAKGFALGLDTKVTGEFIKGVDSWFTMSLLRTMEDVAETDTGFVPRPSDQRLTFGMYFQDELPINPNYKVHMTFFYGSGLKFGPPRNLELRTVFGASSYQRVDLGFSRTFTFGSWYNRSPDETHKLKIESLWVAVEIFNLFQRSNVVSYTWITDVFNTQFAVPNYLSARLLNVRAMVKF